jgi:hypothetical protein
MDTRNVVSRRLLERLGFTRTDLLEKTDEFKGSVRHDYVYSLEVNKLEQFSEAYQAALYKTNDVAFTLSNQPPGISLFENRPFAIITAHNPRSERLSDSENKARHETLRRELISLGLTFAPSTGESPDGSWLEEGFIIFETSLEQALELGRKFAQHAIIYGQGKTVSLAWCEDGRREDFYIELFHAQLPNNMVK